MARGDQGDGERARDLAGRALESYRTLGLESFAGQVEELERALVGKAGG